MSKMNKENNTAMWVVIAILVVILFFGGSGMMSGLWNYNSGYGMMGMMNWFGDFGFCMRVRDINLKSIG